MASEPTSTRTLLVLAGRPSVRDFVRTIKVQAVAGIDLEDADLLADWRRANEHVRALEKSEGAICELGELTRLPADVEEEALGVLREPMLQKSLGLLPYSWALVELDRLIAWQNYVDMNFATSLRECLGTRPAMRDLMRFAAGLLREPPPLHVTARSGNNFVFHSRSSDLRVIEAVPIDPASVQGFQPRGQAHSVIAVFIGYSCNVMSAIHMDNRLVLTNGTHRAYAMRAHGVTHAPCIVRHVSSKEDLDVITIPKGSQPFEWFVKSPRPPLLKDFFAERLTKSVQIPASTHVLEMELKFERSVLPFA